MKTSTNPTRPFRQKLAARLKREAMVLGRAADPFRAARRRARSLRALKWALVRFGRSGDRAAFSFVRRAFAAIRELRNV